MNDSAVKLPDKFTCTGCGACFNKCPQHAISMQEDALGFLYPAISADRCVKCNICTSACPELQPKSADAGNKCCCFAAWSLDRKVRKSSSSGGIFVELASAFISEGGVVFGAAYNDKFDVVHRSAARLEDLPLLSGSKYAQSDTGNSFAQTAQLLREQKKVMFCGTPCQIVGLYSFLGNQDTTDLLTVDLICHGVPAPGVFRSYRQELQRSKLHSEAIKSYEFRNKRFSWSNYCTYVTTENHAYCELFKRDRFMNGFLKNYYLRESCYKCAYANLQRPADITLGDFWGYDFKIGGKFNHDSGCSLVIVSGRKGNAWMDKIKGNIFCRKVDIAPLIKYNPALSKPAIRPPERDAIANSFPGQGFSAIVKKFDDNGYPASFLLLKRYGKAVYLLRTEILPYLKFKLVSMITGSCKK